MLIQLTVFYAMAPLPVAFILQLAAALRRTLTRGVAGLLPGT